MLGVAMQLFFEERKSGPSKRVTGHTSKYWQQPAFIKWEVKVYVTENHMTFLQGNRKQEGDSNTPDHKERRNFNMNFEKNKEVFTRFITDSLYADMEDGNVDFLKIACGRFIPDINARIMEMRKRNPKISSNVENAVYEDIIAVVIEEIIQKRNQELYEALMQHYCERFPYIAERFGEVENNMLSLTNLYDLSFNKDKGRYSSFLHKTFILLYSATYGEKGALKELGRIQKAGFANYTGRVASPFYDRRKGIKGFAALICNQNWGIAYDDSDEPIRIVTETYRERLAAYYEIEPEYLEEFILNHVLWFSNQEKVIGGNTYLIRFEGIQDGFCDICRENGFNHLELRNDSNKMHYLDIIKNVFEKWCVREINNSMNYAVEMSKKLLKVEYLFENFDEERCISEVTAMFWFECFLEGQQGIWDEYYRNFSFDNKAEVMEELYEKCSHLNDENIRYRKKLQSYEEADSLRKKQQNKMTKESDRKYMKKIALLEKQIGEQAMLQENMDEYIRLVEGDRDKKIKVDETDYSKIYGHKIVFVGGASETESRLKAVFSKSEFINDENVPIPKKTDLIVLLAGNGNRSLYYKCLETARKLHIKVIYCAADDVKTAAAMVSDSL